MITAISNIFINSSEKLNIFKETFPLVYEISDNWLIYVRGKYNKEVIKYIKSFKNSQNNCIFFENLHDNNWAKSTSKMLEKSKYEYVYIFLEDHFLLKNISYFKKVIQEATINNIDYFQYSAFNIGINTNQADSLYPENTKNFYLFNINNSRLPELKNNFKRLYPFTLISICKKTYLAKILSIENKLLIKVNDKVQFIVKLIGIKYPKNRILYTTLNKILYKFNIKLNIYSKNTPFNLERSIYDTEKVLLPIRFGVLRKELFANWDDDNGLYNSSLIKRGLYPTSLIFVNNLSNYKFQKKKKYLLKKGQFSEHQYYPDISRVTKIPVKRIKLISGNISINTIKETFSIEPGKTIHIAANIKHKIIANKDSKFLLSLSY